MMTENIQIPRAALALTADRELWQLYGYLLSKADAEGIIDTSLASMQRDLRINQKPLRTLLGKLEKSKLVARQGSKQGSKITLFGFDCSAPQGAKQRVSKRAKAEAKQPPLPTLEPEYTSPSFVAEEFRELWHRYMLYRKEIRKPYKSLATEKTAYNKMLKLAGGNLETAKDIIERAILGQWQGLYEPTPNNGNRNNYPTSRVNPPRTDEERVEDYADLAQAVLRRVGS